MPTAQSKANAKYRAATLRRYSFELSEKYDADLIRRLESVPNKQGYLKALIRADIASGRPPVIPEDAPTE